MTRVRGMATWVTPVAGIVGGLAVVLGAAVAAGAVINRSSIHDLSAAGPIYMFMPVGFGVVGALIATRQPSNPTGWLFLFMAAAMGLAGVTRQYALLTLVTQPGAAPGGEWAAWFGNWLVELVYPAAAALTLLVVPGGHLPSKRWLPVAVGAVAIGLFAAVPLNALKPGPMGVPGLDNLANPAGVQQLQPLSAGPLPDVTWAVASILILAAASAPFVRMRRARGEEQMQLRWIAYVVVTTALAALALSLAYLLLPSYEDLFGVLLNLVLTVGWAVALPVACAIAVFRHRLYDIDVVISRTLVYGSLAAFVTAVYVGIAVGVGSLIGSGGRPNLALSLLATASVAVAFQPLRRRLQSLAARLVYGDRATPYEVLSHFSQRLAESYGGDELPARLAWVLAEGARAEWAEVWLRSGPGMRRAGVWPADRRGETAVVTRSHPVAIAGADRTIPVHHQGELLGALAVGKRRGEPLTPTEERLISDLANQAGPALQNISLTAELRERLKELRASRQRLVAAHDEERRRLERDLHDGAQQRLVALKVKLSLAELLADTDLERTKAALVQLKSDADGALAALRDLARGIYPPLLAERGLAAALTAQARAAALPVTVDPDGLARCPRDIEAAVYFCCLESLQNVVKYAEARGATIRLRKSDLELVFEVVDDGHGFDAGQAQPGTGLQNMRDRLEALGGYLEVHSEPGRGTRVRGQVPLAES